MYHGSGVISSLFLLVIRCVVAEIHGCGSSIASAATLVTLGASDGTAECVERRRARVGRSSKEGCTAGPSAPAGRKTCNVSWPGGGHSCSLGDQTSGTAARSRSQIVDIVINADTGAIVQELSTDMTGTGMGTDALSKKSMTSHKESRSVQLYFVLIMLCTGRVLDLIGSGMEAWRILFQAYSPKNNARLVVMMLEVLAFPLDTNDLMNSLETMEQKIKESEEIREH